ncbi:MAG: hypothetical protein OEQ18_09520 [Gammaproteobacteria bacterium]|nr:hypothetical protein [Gammaproteobacteria bacterium]
MTTALVDKKDWPSRQTVAGEYFLLAVQQFSADKVVDIVSRR